MLSGVKFIPRDQLLQQGSGSDSSTEEANESSRSRKRREKHGQDEREKKDGGKRHRDKRKKRRKSRYSDDDDSPLSSSSGNGSDMESDQAGKTSLRRRRMREDSSGGSYSSDPNKKRGARRRKHQKESKEKRDKGKSIDRKGSPEDDGELPPKKSNVLSRKEMGLEWMMSSGRKKDSSIEEAQSESKPQFEEEKPAEQANSTNPRELNPYFKDNGSGYPDDAPVSKPGNQPLPSVVGDGGVSWRLKALKRAKEQAAREGRKLDEVVEERWGSLGQLAASVAARRAAPSRAHLHAIWDRNKGQDGKPETTASVDSREAAKEANRGTRDYLSQVSSRHSEMRKPKNDNLSWKRNKGQNISTEDKSLISAAIKGLNQFADDGSFMNSIICRQAVLSDSPNEHGETERKAPRSRNSSPMSTPSKQALSANQLEREASSSRNSPPMSTPSTQALSANQLAAKALQLRMRGKHEEAEKLSREMAAMMEEHDAGTAMGRQQEEHDARTAMGRQQTGEHTSRHVGRQISNERKRREDDADLHLAQTIIQNKRYSMSGRADDEYDYDEAPSRSRRRRKDEKPDDAKMNIPSRFLTQQERCQFCFENPSRPRHLVISIANFTYMMLPQWQPVVQGHCCILPMQHDSSTRTVDKNVWEELRNFKKCLLRMFAEQDKGVVFLETVVDLGKQRRHCLIECIPMPYELSKQAPLYFKKAIDEAEAEWGQHEMKKVIPTSGNLRNVIPENFSYFHVEFGLDRGFVHVIDDDSNFKSSFGLNVVRGMLRLPEEDMHRRRRHETAEKQKEAVATFAREWELFDWTKELG